MSAHDLSQHCTVPEGHVELQFMAEETQGPNGQRMGVCGGQEQRSALAAHLESQHSTWAVPQAAHWLSDKAHDPVRHTKGSHEGHALAQTLIPKEPDEVAEVRTWHRGALAVHWVILVMFEHARGMHLIAEALYWH